MMPESDIRIKEEVMRALKYDPRINVTVSGGVVKLTGTVDSYAIRLLAQEATQFVDGVFSVNNEIKVDSPGFAWTDAELKIAIRKALEWDALVPNERIEVTVSNGWVALEGQVELLREREDAERIVRRMAGVRGVYNSIVVNSSEARTENIRVAIEEELKQRAKVEAGRIQVIMRDGTVTLSGQVQSWEEERAVVKAAGCAPGVHKINDCLQIIS